MGHRAITNCAWSLGERTGGALGYLVGKEGAGLACMFGMMNAMRIEVGLGAACLGKRGYLESLASCIQVLTTAPSPFPTGKRGYLESLVYAREREQGGCAIIEHDDVKRMLLLQKAYAEGGYALSLGAAAMHDRARAGDKLAGALLDLQTEIVKSWPSEWCLEANKLAIQVHTDSRTVAMGLHTDSHTVAMGLHTDSHTVATALHTDSHTVAMALHTDSHTVAMALHTDCPSHRLSHRCHGPSHRLPFTSTLTPSPWQVLGGECYVRDYPVEQLYRDNRLNMIHEGTAGRHAKRLLVIASDGP